MRGTVSAVVGLIALVGLTGCATASGGAAPTPSSSPTDVLMVDAAWVDGGRMIGIVTIGSSTCVPVAEDSTYADGRLSVTIADPDDDAACTRDLLPRVTLVDRPSDVDPTAALEIDVTYQNARGDAELGGFPAPAPEGITNYEPSAGWTRADGQFVIVTWGSSGCKPVVSDAAITETGEVAVTFAEPAEDTACTADMGPRATVVSVEKAADAPAPTVAILTGDGFNGTRVDIVGP